eukprot:SAG31_NODE_421_length_15868_cov_8.966453_2_plen_318_part_00
MTFAETVLLGCNDVFTDFGGWKVGQLEGPGTLTFRNGASLAASWSSGKLDRNRSVFRRQLTDSVLELELAGGDSLASAQAMLADQITKEVAQQLKNDDALSSGNGYAELVGPESCRIWHDGKQLRGGDRTLNESGLQLVDERIQIGQRIPFVDPAVNHRIFEVEKIKPTDTLGHLADQLQAQDVQPVAHFFSMRTVPGRHSLRLTGVSDGQENYRHRTRSRSSSIDEQDTLDKYGLSTSSRVRAFISDATIEDDYVWTTTLPCLLKASSTESIALRGEIKRDISPGESQIDSNGPYSDLLQTYSFTITWDGKFTATR